MKNLALAFMVAMAFVSVGCKKKAGGGAGEAMAKMTEFKDEMCKCKDAKCAQDVSDRMTKWSQEQSKTQKEAKMSDEDTKKAAAIGEEMGKCMQSAMGAGAVPAEGSAAPAEGSAAPAEGAAAGSAEGSAAPAAEGSAAAPAAEGSAAAPAAEGSAAAPAEKK